MLPDSEHSTTAEAIQPPPLWPEKQERRRNTPSQRGRRPRGAEENTAAWLTPSPPRPAERASTSSEPHRRLPPPCHHGRPGGRTPRQHLKHRETTKTWLIGQRWLAAAEPAPTGGAGQRRSQP
jgi:hypothetical protein